MSFWQNAIILLYAFINFLVFGKGFYESKYKKNAYGLTPGLFILGIFVWGDAVIFGLFWFLSSLISYLLNDWLLFFLIISVFWVIRSLGETIYWINQQFSSKIYDWNKPENLLLRSVFHNDSIWFIYQTTWQCITIVSVITTIYLANLWLNTF